MWEETDRLRLVRLCATISGDRQAAEDLAQETLLEAWRNAHKVTDPDGADRWLGAIARNVCLRWRRRRSRAEVAVAEPPEQSFEEELADPCELVALLPEDARELLVERYVHERTSSEIAASLGVSSASVTMRLQRGKAMVRRLVDPERWSATQLWCACCGDGRLEMRREHGSIAFRCHACTPEGCTSVFPLDNPLFERLVGGLQRPSAMLARVGSWARDYYAAGDGAAAECTRCGGAVTIRRHEGVDEGMCGFHVHCSRCGEELWQSLSGLALAAPEVRELRRTHPRTRALPAQLGRGAVVIRIEPPGAHGVEVAFDPASFRLLGAT